MYRTIKRKITGTALIISIAGLMAACLALGSTTAQAGQTVTAKATVVFSGPVPTVLPAGDDPNHLVGMGTRKGTATFEDGSKAVYSNVFFFDMVRGKSMSIIGYTKMAFADGSWLFFKWKSGVVGRDQNGPLGKGTGVIQSGSGKYKGIKGTVAFTNRRLPRSKEMPGGGTEAKAVLTYTLP